MTQQEILNQIAALTISLGETFSDQPSSPSSALPNIISIMDYGAVFDRVTDDTAAFEAAIAALPNGGTIMIPMGGTKISRTLYARAPILLKSAVRGDISNNTNGSGWANSRPIIRWAGAEDGYMFILQPTNIGDVIWGGGSEGIEWDGAGVASTAVQFDNTKFAIFDGKIRNVKWAGLLLSSIRGTASNFSMRNHVRTLEFVWGVAAQCKPASGLVMIGNWSNIPSTQQFIGDVAGLIYDGDLVRIHETDNAHIGVVHGVVQSGGTGSALNLKSGGAQNASHTVIGYAVGPIKTDAGVIGTKIEHYNSEASGLSGGSSWNGDIVDYVTGVLYTSHKYALRKKIEVSSGSFRALDRAQMGTADYALQWNTLTFPDGVTSIASVVIPAPYDMALGLIEGVEILYGSNASGGGNVRFHVYASTAAIGESSPVVTAERKILSTGVVAGQYTTVSHVVAMNPELTYAKGDSIHLSITRLGADPLDTNTAALHLLGARILYRGVGPNSTGSGTYAIPEW